MSNSFTTFCMIIPFRTFVVPLCKHLEKQTLVSSAFQSAQIPGKTIDSISFLRGCSKHPFCVFHCDDKQLENNKTLGPGGPHVSIVFLLFEIAMKHLNSCLNYNTTDLEFFN